MSGTLPRFCVHQERKQSMRPSRWGTMIVVR
jgi:hypothetical protein